MKITAVVLTRNEARSLEECLKGLAFAQEAMIIDDDSTDQSRLIAQKLGVKIYQRRLKGDFARQRNFALDKANCAWVFFVDADERVTLALSKEISQLNPSNKEAGFKLKRKDYFLGRWLKYGETSKVKLLRLAKKKAGRWQRKVHEFWLIKDGKISELKNCLLHYPHEDLSAFLSSINQYTSLNSLQFHQEGRKFRIFDLIFYPIFKFFLNYFFRLGFLDGFPGLVMAGLMSYHSLITRIKLWEIEQGEKK